MRGYTRAIAACFNFAGRTERAPFWQFTAIAAVLVVIAGLADHAFDHVPLLSAIVLLIHLLPGLAVQVRRLHDGGRSGWWLLLAPTGFGLVLLLIWFCCAGHPGPNRFSTRQFHQPMANTDGLPYAPSLTTDPGRLAALSEARSSPYPTASSSFLSDSFLLLIGCAAVVPVLVGLLMLATGGRMSRFQQMFGPRLACSDDGVVTLVRRILREELGKSDLIIFIHVGRRSDQNTVDRRQRRSLCGSRHLGIFRARLCRKPSGGD